MPSDSANKIIALPLLDPLALCDPLKMTWRIFRYFSAALHTIHYYSI
ncbi:hypothetical protein EYZ11_012293 [Aspergillus tanneri]|uniref:Uncharacterized protein n=1 Tax=Aspergillus tanneri TaxID=1220188 RepID=A0A4S3J602_9EURO|nr:hypothetical protein EYZ11_012293 [Aspergillus tanneri]